MKVEHQLPPNKAVVLADLRSAFRRVELHITSLSATDYSKSAGHRWHPAEHLEHLLLSTIPIVGALGKDRHWFDQFAPPDHPDKTYVDLKAYYKTVLSTGLKAPARFVPAADKVYEKDRQLADWERLETALAQKLSSWSEAELDRCTLPHPALGSLSMRQMLQFTAIHTEHHLNGMKV